MDDRVAQLEELSRNECMSLLTRTRVGRVGLVVDGRVEVLPVNFVIDGETVLFRTAEDSPLAGAGQQLVAFEADEIDAATGTGWSVLMHGQAQDIGDAIDGTSRRLRDLPLTPWAGGVRDRWFHVVPDRVTGRRITVSPADL